MADYVIGDVQGCYDALMRLLTHIQFNQAADRLWFVGDLVNRGPQSLEVLRFVSQLPIPAVVTLGNHDLYLLARLFLPHVNWGEVDDTLQEVLNAPDVVILREWLRFQPLVHRDVALNVVMVHAGIAPMWSIDEAVGYAHEVEQVLRGEHVQSFLSHLHGNEPSLWSNTLQGMDRLRCITNYFTRLRFCDAQGRANLSYKGTIDLAPSGVIPWYLHSHRQHDKETVVFGHWAALGQLHPAPRVYALDTGCVWGQTLTAMCLQDNSFFSVGASG